MNKVDILISFDATGSMWGCLLEVRRKVSEVVDNLFTKFPDIRIALICHGNLEDVPSMERFEFSQNKDALIHFVKTVESKSGGGVYHQGIGNPANYELVLSTANEWLWRDDAQKYMIMLGDVDAHKVGEKRFYQYGQDLVHCTTDWKTELGLVASKGISIFAVQCLGNKRATPFWQTLAQQTNGKYIELNQLSQVVELINLAVYSVHDEALAEEYAETLSLNRGFQAIANQILGKQKFAGYAIIRQDGLVPVPPNRFQLLHVDAGATIRDFVNHANIGKRYEAGKGFYQLTKSELVQEYKEVIVVDKITGDMFSGNQARDMIGLSFGERGKVSPRNIKFTGDWDIYVQSTSYTRKLMPNTNFLYEMTEIKQC